MKRLFIRIIKGILLIFLILIILPYLISPVYDFPEKTTFKGNNFYNPYENIDSAKWYKANFHSHSNVWSGFTSGRESSIDTIIYVYKLLKYDIIGISNYMIIANDYLDSNFIMPVYEHGYGIFKIHYLVIGGQNINLIDFFLYQSLSNKQFIVKNLKTVDNIVAIVHPNMLKAFSERDFEYLTDYDCVEILRYDRVSTKYWDAALSAGNLKFLIANDDLHNITAPYETGRCFTMINSPTKERKQIINSIKSGKTYGVDWRATLFDSLGIKLQKMNDIPYLNYLIINFDTIIVKVNRPAADITFIGQDGKVCSSVKNTDVGTYRIADIDSYVRTEITFSDNTKMYLNPIIKYENEFPPTIKKAEINIILTIINKLIYLLIIVGLIIIIKHFKKKKKTKTPKYLV